MGPTSKMKNVLDLASINFNSGFTSYIFSAIVPCDSSLRVQFTPFPGSTLSFAINPPYYGWKNLNTPGKLNLECQRKNFQNGFVLTFTGPVGIQDSAKVEYFENNSSTPYFTKIIYW